MPRIPVYDQQQVQAGALPTPQLANPPAATFGDAIGKGMASLGNSVMRVMAKEQEEADSLRSEERINELRESVNVLGFDKDNGAFNVKGANVFNRKDGKPYTKEYLDKFDAEQTRLRSTLSSDRQKELFDRAAGRIKNEFGGQLMRHESGELVAHRKSIYEGVLKTESENVARNFDDPYAVNFAVSRVADSTRVHARDLGMDGKDQDAAVQSAVSAMHLSVIQRTLNGDPTRNIPANPAKAKAMYTEQVKNGVIVESSKEAGQIRTLIENDVRDMGAQSGVDEVWKSYMYKDGQINDKAPVELDKMEADLREKFKNDPDSLKLAIMHIKERANAHGVSVKQREHKIGNAIFKEVLVNKPLSEIRKMDAFKQLDEMDQAAMIQKIEQFRKRDALPIGEQREAIRQAQDIQYWSLLENYKQLAAMTEEEIYARTPELGRANVNRLLNKKLELAGGIDGEIAIKIDMDHFKQRAKMGGLRVDNPGEKDKAVLGDLKARAEEMISIEQQRLKRPMDRKEKEELYDALLLEVPVKMEVTGMFGGKSTEYDTKRVYEVKNMSNIGKPGDREKVIRTLKAQKPNEEIDEIMVLRLISQMNKKK
jgi:hypothetical protein